MYNTFDEIISKAGEHEKRKVAVVRAEDKEIIDACKLASEKGLISPVFIGDEKKIKELDGIWEGVEIINCTDDSEAAFKAVELAREKKVHMIMKGKVKSSTFLKAIVNKKTGITGGNILSHILVFEKDSRLRVVTDGGMIMYPDLNEKVKIINNAVKILHSLGNPRPNVAALCAVETVNPAMKDTVDAALLSTMNVRGQIRDCNVDGPLAIDNAVSREAAQLKGIDSDVAGDSDILLVPDIEAGNILGKSLIYFANCESGGVIAGAQVPVIMLSRADKSKTKLNSIALAMVCS